MQSSWPQFTGRNQKQLFSGGKGAFETSCPLLSTLFSNQKKGVSNLCYPQKKRTEAQIGTNRHKPAQIGTNRHNFWKLICLLFIVCTPVCRIRAPLRREWDRCLGANAIASVVPGERALEEAPTTVIIGHAGTDDGDGHSQLKHSLCMMIIHRATIWGRVTVGPKTKRDCGTKQPNWHKPAQTSTNKHKLAQFLCRTRGEITCPLFLPFEHNRGLKRGAAGSKALPPPPENLFRVSSRG
jgi:hypothetical protein